MILVTHERVGEELSELERGVISAFPSEENLEYINEIKKRGNCDSVKESLTALLLLERAVRALGGKSEGLIFSRSQNGKPFFRGGEYFFSVTHSSGLVAVAVSDGGEVGIDLECAELTDERAARLSSRYFEGNELTSSNLLRRWVRTEAYVKLLGTTLSDKLSRSAREDVNFYDLAISGYPAAIAYFGEQEIVFLN